MTEVPREGMPVEPTVESVAQDIFAQYRPRYDRESGNIEAFLRSRVQDWTNDPNEPKTINNLRSRVQDWTNDHPPDPISIPPDVQRLGQRAAFERAADEAAFTSENIAEVEKPQ